MAHSDNNSRNYTIPDYDFGDDVLYKQEKPKPKRRNRDNDIAALFAMCVFTFLVLGTFVMIKITPGMEFKLGAFFSKIGATPNPAYQLGNVKLGTTMDVLRTSQPGAQKAMTSNGSILLSFSEKDAKYMVWYGEDGPYHIAYKARQNRTIEGISEDDYIGTIAKRYGAPSVSTCTRRITDGLRDCRFSWWMPEEVRLDLISRQDTSAATPRLDVTMIATDTRLEGRIQRDQLTTTVQAPN